MKPNFRLSHTDGVNKNLLYHHCLLHNIFYRYLNNPNRIANFIGSSQVILYCIRSSDLSSNLSIADEQHTIHGTSITFEALKEENITSEQLYLLSTPIDVVERYQEFLESSNLSLSTQRIYNCSQLWFGEYCQYSFNLIQPFDAIVSDYLSSSSFEEYELPASSTCYTFIECNRGPSPACLDWREICDGKIDCLGDARDEFGCDQLDKNECKEDEFRCTNGLCIPKEFFNDNRLDSDCIDRSDEKYSDRELDSIGYVPCSDDNSFRCEETACRNERMLSCGDGQCTAYNCQSERDVVLKETMLSWNANLHLSFDCWASLICLQTKNDQLWNLFSHANCAHMIDREVLFRRNCPSVFFFPSQPILLGHVRFAYVNNLTNQYALNKLVPHYICYDQALCEWLPSTVLHNGSTCRRYSELDIKETLMGRNSLEYLVLTFFLKCSTTSITYAECPKSKPYRCANSSKCIVLNRLMDGFVDCFQGDDEQIADSCSLPDINYRFRCFSENKCIPMTTVHSDRSLCIGKEDMRPTHDISQSVFYLSFTSLCDGFVEHNAIDGLNYTDEMDCEDWPCINTYTRCDGTWNCRNAADEADCSNNLCRPNGYPCILPFTHNFTCLPLSRINDGHIDCVGGYDEQDRCGPTSQTQIFKTYRCSDEIKCIGVHFLCDAIFPYCSSGDDERLWCIGLSNSSYSLNRRELSPRSLNGNEILYLRHISKSLRKMRAYFTVKNHLTYPTIKTIANDYNFTETTIQENQFSIEPEYTRDHELNRVCNRGIAIYRHNFNEQYCLCPPAYFGQYCQNQSQRVSVTLLFRTVEWRTIFNFVILLVDENANIHSSEQIDYLSIRDCRKKFDLYLLYLSRPKHTNETYYVRIDIYNKENMVYYFSNLYPIRYLFLPVYRLSVLVNIPMREVRTKSMNCPLKCLHGQCKHYLNVDEYFCQCDNGYSGRLCTIKNSCNCAPGSLCIGVVNNRAICLCPIGKFGSRCYLKRTVCIWNKCTVNGRCIPSDDKYGETEYFCLCSQGYTGSTCNSVQRKIEFQFSESIIIPQTILIHFIYVTPTPESYNVGVYPDADSQVIPPDPTQTTMMSQIKSHESSALVYYGGRFHFIFVEFHENYYLALLQHNNTLPMNVLTTIIPQHRCLSIEDLLSNHIQSLPLWHRAKYYHIPCEKYSNLVCFRDNHYFMCLCDVDRHANCFKFDYNSVYNCLGYNYCENDGQCYIDNRTCPTSSSCLCKECYYGSRCQFTTKGFGVSLDDILGYSIWPRVPFSEQPGIVKITTAVTAVMFIAGVVNTVLSFVTFTTQGSLAIGSGLYLLASSITSLIMIIIFTIKFLLLVLSQMSLIINASFLLVNCICIDMFLKAFLAIGEWLTACVSIERMLTVKLGVTFNKSKSKKAATRVIIGIYLFTLTSFSHEAFSRHLLNVTEEERIWCVVRYSLPVQRYASFINIFHFILPLFINFISTTLMIVLIAREKSKARQELRYKEHLWKQLHVHKHRLLSSFALVIIDIPRLIISFVSKCMKSARNPWLYLVGYFISFIPPLLVFVLYVLPSDFYRKQFSKATIHIKKKIQHRLRYK